MTLGMLPSAGFCISLAERKAKSVRNFTQKQRLGQLWNCEGLNSLFVNEPAECFLCYIPVSFWCENDFECQIVLTVCRELKVCLSDDVRVGSLLK